MKSKEKIECDKCRGDGWYGDYDYDKYRKTGKIEQIQVQCGACYGTGKIEIEIDIDKEKL